MEIRRLAPRPLTGPFTPVPRPDTTPPPALSCTRCGEDFGSDPTLRVVCPVCGAPAGRRCHRPAEGGLHQSHLDRARIALRTGCMGRCPTLSWDELHCVPLMLPTETALPSRRVA
ncbi:hypothetical protein LPC08_24475 (plasmid) [Roseomonas sp. OT10]|uniref:hypothetical protein n=1 Tax=Roseomonas cutis TaxID=2897332 RepID=UPI001E4ACE39|nr:hypothetical protein [Roseomonas sp. OT10]UFN51679.1 hypothetical protein LPC08_24475 [Roseomonas sp. OT10]